MLQLSVKSFSQEFMSKAILEAVSLVSLVNITVWKNNIMYRFEFVLWTLYSRAILCFHELNSPKSLI